MGINQELNDLREKNDTSQAAWDAVDGHIDSYQKQLGVTPKTTHNEVLLRRTELRLAKVATYRKYHDKGFEVAGISLDKDKMQAFTTANGMTWPQYFDGKDWENKISTSYNITSIPTMWLIDKKGMYVSEAGDDIAPQVEKLLGAP